MTDANSTTTPEPHEAAALAAARELHEDDNAATTSEPTEPDNIPSVSEQEEFATSAADTEPHEADTSAANGEPEEPTHSPETGEGEDVATSVIPPHIRRLLGDPPLLRGESKEEFNALLEQLALEANPKDFTSWLLVAEKAAKLWEYGRLQRLARAVVDDKFPEAVEDAFGDLSRFDAGRFTPEQVRAGAESLAIGVQRGVAEDKDALTAVLEGWGCSVDILYASAMEKCQEQFLYFRKQAEGTRRELRQLDRDNERHLFALTQRPKASKVDVEDIDFKEAA